MVGQNEVERRTFLKGIAAMAMQAASRTSAQTMKQRVEVVHTRAFAATPEGGNPCPVVLHGESLSDVQMLSIAKMYGYEAAFVLPPTTKADIRIRYFLPDHELGVSGHATIAALSVARSRGILQHSGAVNVETITGVFPALIESAHAGELITLQQGPPSFAGKLDKDVVAVALGCSQDAIGSTPIQSVSVSRPKLILPLREGNSLAGLSPSQTSVDRLCESANVSGIYPFTLQSVHPGADVEARQYPYRAGYAEDAATGIAAVALAAYVFTYLRTGVEGANQLTVAQGYTMGRPSVIGAKVFFSKGEIISTEMFGNAHILRSEWVSIPV